MRRRTVALLAIIVILITVGSFIYVQRTGLIAPLGGRGLSGTDFLGTWLNAWLFTHNPTAPIIGGLVISENQGTYTLTVILANGVGGGTNVLTVNPLNAHAFVIMQLQPNSAPIISADLTLQLLNSTFVQAKESVDSLVSNLSTTSLLATEQFIKWSGSFPTQSTTSQFSQMTTQPTQAGGYQTKEQMIMEAYGFPSGGPLVVQLRNVGSASEDLLDAEYFINGVKGTLSGTCTANVTPGGSCQAIVTLTSYGSLIPNAAYPFKIVTPTGGVFSYTVIYGGSS